MSFPVEILKALSHCPVCHKEYKPAKLSILAEKEGKTLLHVTCEMCQVSSIVSATATPGGAICMGLLTDLAQVEGKRVCADRSVTTDDVLALHQRLATTHSLADIL